MKFLEFSSLFDLLNAFPTEESCIVYLEKIRWSGNTVSPFQEDSKVYKCKGGRYKCSATNKYFNVRTGGIFQDSNMPLQKWFMAIYIFATHKKGISSHQLARDLSITQKTAWFVLHRIRLAMSHRSMWDVFDSGTVEVDEMYIGGKEGNKHRQGKEERIGPRKSEKQVVFGIVQREGQVFMQHVEKANASTLVPIIEENVSKDVTIISDEHHAYSSLSKTYIHMTVEHGANEFVRGSSHTNTIEGVWSQMKRGIYGIYHQTSKKHLQAYCNEFAFRHNVRKQSEYNKVNSCLFNTSGGTLKYHQLIGKSC